MRSRSAADDTGAAAAEFAVAVPAVALVLAVCLGGVAVGAQQVRLQDAAADAARGLGRGDPFSTVLARAIRSAPGAALEQGGSGELVCARLTARARGPLTLAGLVLSAESCALAGGG